jgi:hypothetical protein
VLMPNSSMPSADSNAPVSRHSLARRSSEAPRVVIELTEYNTASAHDPIAPIDKYVIAQTAASVACRMASIAPVAATTRITNQMSDRWLRPERTTHLCSQPRNSATYTRPTACVAMVSAIRKRSLIQHTVQCGVVVRCFHPLRRLIVQQERFARLGHRLRQDQGMTASMFRVVRK